MSKMTPQQLKNSILQMAMQGKLVEQHQEEGMGEVPKLKRKKLEELELNIPKTWKTAHLETISKVIPSKKYQIKESETLAQGKYPVISQSKEYSIGYSNNLEKLFVHDIPVVIFGDHTTVVKYVDFNFIVGADGVKIFQPDEEFIEPSFLFFELKYYAQQIGERGRYSRHYKYIKNKPFVLPPLSEQKRIVAKLEEIQPLLDRYEKAYNRLEIYNQKFPENLKKSILQYAVEGKLVEQRPEEGTGEELFKQIQAEKKKLIKEGKIKKSKKLPEITEDEIPFEIPENWKWVRWGDLSLSIQYGYNAPAQKTGRIKMVRISDIHNNKVAWNQVPYCDIEENEIPTYTLKKNDILFARTGGTVGKSYIVKDIPEEAIYAGYLIRTRYSELLEPMYLKYFMESALYWKQLKNGTIATAQPNCNGKTLSKMILPIPPAGEQKRIVAKIEELMPMVETLEGEI
ncbi:MAG: restriction endonuclease subunit S [Pseudoramibacter sp.]|jgi:type I restriction enzyme S subunit